MAKSRSTPTSTRPFVSYLDPGNVNGAPPPETDAERIARIEGLLTRMQTTLETQFVRMAEMQVLIDHLNAEGHRENAVSDALPSSVPLIGMRGTDVCLSVPVESTAVPNPLPALLSVVLCPRCKSDGLTGIDVGPDLCTYTVRCSECGGVSVITISE